MKKISALTLGAIAAYLSLNVQTTNTSTASSESPLTFENDSTLNILTKEEAEMRQYFHLIGEDTTFNNSWYRESFPEEIALWEKIYTTDSLRTIEYDKRSFVITNMFPTRFAFDSLELADGSFQRVFSPALQSNLDKLVLDSIHLQKTGKHMPAKKSARSYGLRFGRLERLEETLTRMMPFMEYYTRRLEEESLPFSALTIAILESEFNPYAISSVSAVGPFQFLPSTAQQYGLDFSQQKKGNHCVYDFRRHPIESFEAFIDYYKDAQRVLGDDNPLFVPISYNTGFHSERFKGVHSKEAELARVKGQSFVVRSYAIQVIALTNIIRDLDTFFPHLNYEYEAIKIHPVEKSIRLKDVPQEYGISQEHFLSLNPQYLKEFTGPIREGRVVILPAMLSFGEGKLAYNTLKSDSIASEVSESKEFIKE